MSKLWTPPRQREVVETDVDFGVVVWQMPDGSVIQDREGNYLSLEGRINDRKREQRMRDYVRANFGITTGKPSWRVGARKIDDNEHADQLEALNNGENPDPVDLWRQLAHGI